MGRYKDYQLEADEYTAATGLVYGLSSGERFACADVSNDVHVRNFINKNGSKGVCSYTGKHAIVVDVVDLAEWAVGKIQQYFHNPQDDGLYLENFFGDDEEERNDKDSPLLFVDGFVTFKGAWHYESTEELLVDFGFATEDALIQDVAGCIASESWINIDSYMPRKDDEMLLDWRQFADKIRKDKDYVPTTYESFMQAMQESGSKPFDMIVDDVVNEMMKNNIFTTIDAGTHLFRCRNIKSEKEVEEPFRDMTSAPDDKAWPNRMSAKGVSIFYGGFDSEVCLAEAVDKEKPLKALAEFRLKKDVLLVDLTNIPAVSLWADTDYFAMRFLHSFTLKVSENYDSYPDEDKQIEYIPTQVLTSQIRSVVCNDKGRRVDGMIYFSSQKPGERNVVLFCNQKDSEEYLDIVDLKIYQNK